MQVLVAEVSFSTPQCQSLKDKRRIRTSLFERLRTRFGVSVAEIADQDRSDTLTMGLALVGSDRRVLEATMNRAIAFAVVAAGDPVRVDIEFR